MARSSAYGHCGDRWQLRERQLLSPRRRLHQRGYWDVDWNKDIRQWHFLWRADNPWIHAGRTDDAASGCGYEKENVLNVPMGSSSDRRTCVSAPLWTM